MMKLSKLTLTSLKNRIARHKDTLKRKLTPSERIRMEQALKNNEEELARRLKESEE